MAEQIIEPVFDIFARILPRSRFFSYFSTVFMISLLIHTLFYVKMLFWIKAFFPENSKRKKAVIVLTLSVIYLLIPIFLRYHLQQSNVKISPLQYYFLFYPASFYHFVVLSYSIIMLFYLPIKLLYRAILWLMEKIENQRLEHFRFSPEWKSKLLKAGIIFPILIILAWIYGNIRFAYFQEITRPVYLNKNLPGSLNGLRILHVTDTHVGYFFRQKDMNKLVDIINRQNADLIVFTGDYIDNSNAYLSEFTEPLKRMKKPKYGIYFCLGNHDTYAGHGRITREIKKIGINVLRNSHRIIQIKNHRLAVVGLEDISTGAEDLDSAFQGVQADFSLLLVHQPYRFEQYAKKGANLVLCGHTHGGQIVLGKWGKRTITPAALASPYIAGFYQSGKSALYVNRGYGVAFFPLRINCDPEIAVITLKSYQ